MEIATPPSADRNDKFPSLFPLTKLLQLSKFKLIVKTFLLSIYSFNSALLRMIRRIKSLQMIDQFFIDRAATFICLSGLDDLESTKEVFIMRVHFNFVLVSFCVIVFCQQFISPAQERGEVQRQIITPKNYPVSISNLGSTVNSSEDDFSPMVLGNGRVLYFTSTRGGDQDIYSTIATAGGWSSISSVGPTLNTTNEEGGTTITPDGHWMIFTACDRDDGVGDCDLYMSEYGGGSWRNVTNLGSVVNSGKWDSQPALSADGMTLYFVSDRPGGFGGTDIWYTTRNLGGMWSAPINAGLTINTSGDEAAPYIAADGRTFYFSSNGHPGMGGMDMYACKWQSGQWSTPQNVGTPLNSEFDDYFYALQLGTDNVFFASDRPGGQGGLDLYVAVPNPFPPNPVTTVLGTVTDAKSKAPLGAKLTVTDLSNRQILSQFMSDDVDGNYVVVLQSGKNYAITAESPGYLFYSDRFDVPKDAPNNMVRKDVKMERDAVRLLVFFDFDKSELKDESRVDLDRAVDLMKGNPMIKVELAGHTDNVGSRDYNKKLSQDRANACREYLISHAVEASRITARGYGMEVPIATNDTEDGRAQNRRVEFRVVRE